VSLAASRLVDDGLLEPQAASLKPRAAKRRAAARPRGTMVFSTPLFGGSWVAPMFGPASK
jgi:hypothetical protein